MIFGKHQVALGVLGMLIMGRALPVWAAETADGNVQEIVITANRMENKKVDTPANVSLVSSEDLTNWNSRSVADALENVPGVKTDRGHIVTDGYLKTGEPGVYALAGDTDGVDGQEETAGGFLAPDSLARAWELGVRPKDRLDDNDGHGFFSALGDSVVTGPTLTNVNDFRAILITGAAQA